MELSLQVRTDCGGLSTSEEWRRKAGLNTVRSCMLNGVEVKTDHGRHEVRQNGGSQA